MLSIKTLLMKGMLSFPHINYSRKGNAQTDQYAKLITVVANSLKPFTVKVVLYTY